MKSSPTNLNKARKEKSRDRAKREADENSARFGRSKEQKELAARRAEKLRATLDSHRVERDDIKDG